MPSDSDSDSDDSLLNAAPTFSRKRTRSSKETTASRQDRILEQAMKFSNENLTQQNRIAQLKREEVDTDDLVAKTRQIQEHNNKKSRKANLDVVEGIEQQIGSSSSDSNDNENNDTNNDIGGLDRDRRLALVHVADTEQSSNLGIRPTLFRRKPGEEASWHPTDLPQTGEEATEYLKSLLENRGGVSKAHEKAILDPLAKQLRTNTLEEFLSEAILADKCRTQNVNTMPKELMEWLFLVACSGAGCSTDGGGTSSSASLANLSEGAYQTLSELWKMGVTPARGAILRLSELVFQLEQWFGCLQVGTTHSQQQAPKESIKSERGRNVPLKGLCSFLKLWELALAQGLVALDDQAQGQACTCLSTLVLAGLDACFHSHEANLRLLAPLQLLLATLMDLCTKTSKVPNGSGGGDDDNDNDKANQWMRSTAAVLATELSQLGPGAIGSEDEDDKEAWLSSALAVRLLVPLTVKERAGQTPHRASAKFCMNLARQVSQSALGCTLEGLNEKVAQLLEKLGLSKQRASFPEWQALASSCIVLSTLVQNENIFSNGKPKCLAITELSHSFLQVGLTLFGNRLAGLNAKDDDDDDDDDMEDTKESENDDIMESNAVFELFEMLEAKTKDIGVISQKQALTSPHLRRVNYQVNCIRQYFRLQKQFFQTRRPDAPVVQSSLHAFFSNKSGHVASIKEEDN